MLSCVNIKAIEHKTKESHITNSSTVAHVGSRLSLHSIRTANSVCMRDAQNESEK